MVEPLISNLPALKYVMMTIKMKKGSPHIDKIFKYVAIGAATYVIALIVMIVVNLSTGSAQIWQQEGIGFLTGSDWNSVEGRESYGAFPYIMGTLVNAGIAMLISVPLSFGIAMFLSELSPRLLRTPLAMVIELLAAVPSVVYGLWGLLVFRTYIQDWIETPLHNLFGDQSIIFAGTPFGLDILTASIVLAIMIVPTIASISKEIMMAVPNSQREAAYMLGATKWEAFRIAVLPYSKSGLIGAVILGLGRAVGETMAVTMLIGNTTGAAAIPTSLFQPSQTMASIMANEFAEASQGGLHLAALVGIGLILFLIAFLINVVAHLLVARVVKSHEGAVLA
jgi:phosphate transport system permease protein